MTTRNLIRSLAVVVAVVASAPSGALAAGEPTMALSAVQPGMACTAKTVLRGTQISTFDVQVVDVVGTGVDARILGRASGPGVDSTGVAQGFSGSPVYCPKDDGSLAIAGAVSAGTGDYGNLLIFITPIETMLAEPVSAASSSAAKSSLTALTYSGVAGPVAAALRSAARRAGRQLIVSPGATRSLTLDASAGLQPGSSVAAGISSGAVAIAAVGTVTYVDGNRIWAFGHPFDGTGRRSLLLQNAYVHAVVGNPLTLEEATPYKLASVLGPIGTLTDDRPAGVSGVLGVLPRTFPLTVTVTNTDTGKLTTERTEVTDELEVGAPGGGTALEQVGPIAVAQAAYNALHGAPSQMTGRMCVRIKIAERKKTLGFCNRYVGAGPTSPGGAMPADIATAVTALGSYRFAPLRVKDVSAQIKIGAQPGLAYMRKVSVTPRNPKPGQRVKVRIESVIAGSRTKLIRTQQLKIPSYLRSGSSVRVRVTGDEPDVSATSPLEEVLNILFDDGSSNSASGPRNVEKLADSIARVKRDDRAKIKFAGRTVRLQLRNNQDVRLSGSAETSVRLSRP